jgi:hypothetical protein
MPTLQENLDFIRKVVDMSIADDIDSIKGKGSSLYGVIGLSAECKKNAKRDLERGRLIALSSIKQEWPASIMSKAIDAHCADQLSDLEYADRLNAAVTHQLDYCRTLISLYKQEMAAELSAAFHNT